MYAPDRVSLVKLEASPSAIWNNLSAAPHKVAFAHKEAVYIISARAVDKREPAPLDKLPIPPPLSAITQVKFLNAVHSSGGSPSRGGATAVSPVPATPRALTGQYFLVVTTRSGFMVFDAWGSKLLLRKSLIELGVREDEVKKHHLAGITVMDSTAYIGTSWGDILQVPLLSDDGEPRLLSPRFRASSVATKHHIHHPITALAATEKYIFSGDENGGVVQWDRHKLAPIKQHEGSGHPVTSLIARRDVAVAGYTSGHLRLFRAGSTAEDCYMPVELAAHARCVTSLDWHPRQLTFVSTGEDCKANVYSLPELVPTEGVVTPAVETAYPATGGFKVTVDSSSLVKDALLCGAQFSRYGEGGGPAAGGAGFGSLFPGGVSATSAAAAAAPSSQPDLLVAAYDSHALRVFLAL